jgi:hypothetical protein
MRYVVKASTDGENYCWLTTPRLGGHRTFADRQLAERFESEQQAAVAIDVMRRKENCRGIAFTIEPVDCSVGVSSS